jgi:arsenate reductase
MAEGWARSLGKGQIEPFSAGTSPKSVHPLAVKVMAEADVDISGQQSKHLDSFVGQEFDCVITVCDRAKESCPIWPGAKKQLHWSFDDPAEATGNAEQRLNVFRRVRDEIRDHLVVLLDTKGYR